MLAKLAKTVFDLTEPLTPRARAVVYGTVMGIVIGSLFFVPVFILLWLW